MLYIVSAILSYLVVGLNPAIIMSKAIYKKDIRECGSGNPGFTNFKRTFGNKWAWYVMLFDLAKAAVMVAIFAHFFAKSGVSYSVGAAYTGLFCLLGHAYPLWYGFKGGKGFLVFMSVIWFVNPVAGLTSTLVMCVLLLTTKYMSLSTMLGILSGVIYLIFANAEPMAISLCGVQVLFIIIRHKENIKRLVKGTESKFSFKSTH